MPNPRNDRFRRSFRSAAAVIISLVISVNAPSASATVSEPICLFEPCINPNQHSIDAAASPWVVVNKTRPLQPKTYIPKTVLPAFANPKVSNPRGERLSKYAARALVELADAAKISGVGTLLVQSGYRSYSLQKVIHASQVARLGKTAGEALAARPGFSEHQTGLAVDVAAYGQGCVIQVCFGKTKMGRWIEENAYLFGFIVRYPSGRTPTTGYQYEPWHLRYVGTQMAGQMSDAGILVLEDFWKLPAAPNY